MSIYGITVDVSRGFDVMRGSRVLASFADYAAAVEYSRTKRGSYIRYWAKKGA